MEESRYISCPICDDYYFTNDDPQDYEDYGYFSKLIDKLNLNANFDQCSRCGWIFDEKQLKDHDLKSGANEMSVNEYKKWYQGKLDEKPDYDFSEENAPEPIPHKCPVCGKYEFEDENSFDICPFCGWEDDGVMTDDPDYAGGANSLSLNDYKKRYEEIISKDPDYKWEKSNTPY